MSEDLDASGRRDARRLGDIRDRGLARRHRDRRRRTRTAERLIDGRNGFFRGLVCFGHLRGSWRSAYGGVSGGQRVRRAPVERTPAPRHARAIAISAVHSSAALATIGLLKIFPTVWRKDAPCAMTAKRKVESQFRICPNSEFGAEWAAPAMRPNFCDSYSFTLSPSHHVALRIFVSYSFQRSVQCGVVHGARGVCSACILRATCGSPRHASLSIHANSRTLAPFFTAPLAMRGLLFKPVPHPKLFQCLRQCRNAQGTAPPRPSPAWWTV